MRVMLLTPWFPEHPRAQLGRFILNSALALRACGHELKLVVTQPWRPPGSGFFHPDWKVRAIDKGAYPTDLGLEVVHYLSVPRNYLRGLSNRFYHAAVKRRLHAEVAAFRPDLIHAHNELPASAALAVAGPLGLPVCATLHGQATGKRVETAAYRSFQARVLSAVDRVILVGEPLRAVFSDLVADEERIRIVPNGVDLAASRADQQSGLEVIRDACVRLISVSNLHEGKGIDLNLRALAVLADSGCANWHYTVVGDGHERLALENLARDLQLANKVRFVGRCNSEQVAGHLRDAHVFVLPSYREAFGIAYLEAMACGLLTIGVEGQGPSVFIISGKTGLLVPPQEVAALAACLRSVLEHPGRFSKIAAAGRKHVAQEYTWLRHAERLTEVYREIVER